MHRDVRIRECFSNIDIFCCHCTIPIALIRCPIVKRTMPSCYWLSLLFFTFSDLNYSSHMHHVHFV